MPQYYWKYLAFSWNGNPASGPAIEIGKTTAMRVIARVGDGAFPLNQGSLSLCQ
jgi:hypothetical protein